MRVYFRNSYYTTVWVAIMRYDPDGKTAIGLPQDGGESILDSRYGRFPRIIDGLVFTPRQMMAHMRTAPTDLYMFTTKRSIPAYTLVPRLRTAKSV